MKTAHFAVISLIFLSCISNSHKNMSKWNNYYGKGLKNSNEEFFKFLFINDSSALLFGTNYTDETLIQKKFGEQNAVVYRSTDSARSWNEIVVGKGRIRDAVAVGEVLFALNNRQEKRGKETSTIYKSSNNGISWDTISVFPYAVRDIVFVTSKNGIIICKNPTSTKRWTVMETTDCGSTWKPILEDNDISNIAFFKDSIYYITKIGNKKTIATFSLPFKNKHLHTLPGEIDYRVSTIDKNNGELWVAGVNNKQSISCVSLKNSNFFVAEVESSSGFFPSSIHVDDNNVYLVAGNIKGGGVDYKFFETRDRGRNWSNEDPPVASYMNPIVYFGKSLWAYAGAGRIQVRKW